MHNFRIDVSMQRKVSYMGEDKFLRKIDKECDFNYINWKSVEIFS